MNPQPPAHPAEWSLFERQVDACRSWLLRRGLPAPFDPHARIAAVDRHYPGGYEAFLVAHGLAGQRPTSIRAMLDGEES